MYQDHFGLFTAPFVLGPRLQFVFLSKTFEETMAHLVYGIEGEEEIILITGAIGTGKTLALKNLIAHIGKHHQVALINVTQCDFRELLKFMLLELDVLPAEGADRADLLHALKLRIRGLQAEGKRCLLVVDEAQNLDLETLEGVRLLTNLSDGESVTLQVVLAGQPTLMEAVEHPDLLQLRQRIRVHYHLTTLDESETRQYIEHRMLVAGADEGVFLADAVQEIQRLSRGVPRLINILADKALLSAYVDGSKHVSAKNVEADRALVTSPDAPPLPRDATPAVLPPGTPVESAIRPARIRLWWIVPAIVLTVVLAWFAWGDGCPAPRADDSESPQDAVGSGGLTPEHDSVSMSQSAGNGKAQTMPVASSTEDIAPRKPAAVARGAALEQRTAPSSAGMANSQVTTPVDSIMAHPRVDESLGPGYFVHTGSFQSLPRAESYVQGLHATGHDAFLKRVLLSGEIWYRVYLGPFADYESAETMDERLKDEHPGAWSMVVRIQ